VTASVTTVDRPPVLDLTDRASRSPIVMRGRTVRRFGASFRVDVRATAVCVALAASIITIACWSISVGDFPIPMSDVIATLLGGGSEDAQFIVESLRLPRVLTAVGVGAALGISGAVFQSLSRNPLGSPDVVGFNSGAALGAVIMIVVVGGSSSQVALGAVTGGLLTAIAVYLLAYKRGVKVYRLVLVGIGVGFAATAVIDYLITRAEIYEVQRAAVWLTGSLNGRGWEHVRTVWWAMAILAPAAVLMQRWLDRLELGDDTAAALGINVGRTKLWLVLIAVCLAALAVAAAGPIAFVAFVAAPVARRLVRSSSACLVPAAFVGALITVGSDLAARRVIAPTELPVGIFTAVIGAPYLLWLITRQARAGAL
jgi:iron complex transport system permease protein